MACGCESSAGTGAQQALLTGSLDSRFASQAPPAVKSGFESLFAVPGGIWTVLLFVAAASYTLYAAVRNRE